MTKICLVSLYSYKLFRPDETAVAPFGGAEVQQYLLGRELAGDRDFEVSFVVGDFYRNQPRSEHVAIAERVIALYRAVRCDRRRRLIDGVVDFWQLGRAMKRADADVYLVRGGGSLAGKVALIARLVLRKKFIYSSAHDRDSDGSFFSSHSWPVNTLFRYAIDAADAVVCQHEGQRVAFREQFGVEATVIRTLYPIEKESIELGREARTYILWVGRLVPFKRPELLAKLANRFPDSQFLLITNSGADQVPSDFRGRSNLEIRHQVPFEEMDRYFRQALVFINTSSREGFPNTFVQAMKNGVPILSLSVDPEGMLEAHGMGRFARGRFQQLVDDLAEILENQEHWNSMSKRAYQYARDYHDSQRVVECYQGLLRNIFE